MGEKGGGGALWKGQGPERREKSSHKTVSLQRDRERESKGQIDREREREEGVAGTMPLQLQVQWLRRCVCDCVRREHFLFCVN